jgi:hypothetical protein
MFILVAIVFIVLTAPAVADDPSIDNRSACDIVVASSD